MIILFTNTKGGVGKSTLATHLAIFLHDGGRRVALLDSDKQASASEWVSEAEPAIRVCHICDPDLAVEKLTELRTEYEFVVCDSPGDINETSRTLMLLADLAIFPVGPSILDVRSLAKATGILKYAQRINGGKPAGRLVLNKVKKRDRISCDLPEVASALGITATTAQVRDLQAFRDAAQQATVVTRMRPNQARSDVENFFRELLGPQLKVIESPIESSVGKENKKAAKEVANG